MATKKKAEIANPPHPGETLSEDFLKPAGLTQRQLAEAIGVRDHQVSGLVNGRIGISPAMACKLGRALSTTPQFWINLQALYDVAQAMRDGADNGVKTLIKKSELARNTA